MVVVSSTLPRPVFHSSVSVKVAPHQSPIRIKAVGWNLHSILPLPPFGGPENQRFHAVSKVYMLTNQMV